jgi:hypothetical protein
VSTRWLVFKRPTGRVSAWECLPEEVPTLVALHTATGSTIVEVARTQTCAVAAKHDALGRCSVHDAGKGRHVCDRCQEQTLSEGLRLSVAVGAAQVALRKMVVDGGGGEGARGARGEQR